MSSFRLVGSLLLKDVLCYCHSILIFEVEVADTMKFHNLLLYHLAQQAYSTILIRVNRFVVERLYSKAQMVHLRHLSVKFVLFVKDIRVHYLRQFLK